MRYVQSRSSKSRDIVWPHIPVINSPKDSRQLVDRLQCSEMLRLVVFPGIKLAQALNYLTNRYINVINWSN